MHWLRLYSEFATDPKVQMMSEAMQRRLVMLFCVESSNGIETFHETDRETALAFLMRVLPPEMADTKREFLRLGFINDDWTLRNWSKRQYVSDSSTARVHKHRAAKKQAETKGKEKVKRFSNVLDTDTDTDTDKRKNKNTPATAVDMFDGIDANVVRDFRAIRKAKKAAITQTAVDGIKREASKAGVTFEAALRMCCERGWAGFKAEWVTGTQPQAQPTKRRKQLGEGSSTNYGSSDPAVIYGTSP